MKDWESEQPLLSSRRRRETGLSGQKTPGGAASTPDLCSQTPSSREPQKVQLPARSLGQWKELLPQTRSQPRQTLAWKPGNTISHLVQQLGQSPGPLAQLEQRWWHQNEAAGEKVSAEVTLGGSPVTGTFHPHLLREVWLAPDTGHLWSHLLCLVCLSFHPWFLPPSKEAID